MKNDLIRVAVIDLYNNEPNQGMKLIEGLIRDSDKRYDNLNVEYKVYDTRAKSEIPGIDYDIYVSSGGPGSPFEGEGRVWEMKYFTLLEKIWAHNQSVENTPKHIFFICHSFQMMCRFFDLGRIQKRYKRSFGVHPVFKTEAADEDWLFGKLPNPYFAADFREYEVIDPSWDHLTSLGATLLSREQERIKADLERAMMAIRISDEIVGTQFHPEADPRSMLHHFKQPERKEQVVAEFGEDKYMEMIQQLMSPDNILLTREAILPKFLDSAINRLRPEMQN